MESHRFDTLTKLLASRPSRWSLLRTLGGQLLAAANVSTASAQLARLARQG
jgi:hypothetical protein